MNIRVALLAIMLALAGGISIGVVWQSGAKPDQKAELSLLTKNYHDAKTRMEDTLGLKLDETLSQHLTGKARREAIDGLKHDLFVLSSNTTGSPEMDAHRAKHPEYKGADDLFAEQYWLAEVPEDVDGHPDFDYRDKVRNKVLKQAIESGADMNYILHQGEGNFRGKRFENRWCGKRYSN